MSDELASTSLLEHLAETGYHSSVFTTYSCYFPFYEEVVLRRLVSAGCTHNVLMVDAARCAEAFAAEETRPRRAGRDYTLIPVKVGGAFHPKMFLRFGKSKGSLLVGSHNVTLSGFGINEEVTNVFRLEGERLRAEGEIFRQAYRYLAEFLPTQLKDVVRAYEAVQLGVPWLQGTLGTGGQGRQLLTQSPSSKGLWSQVAPLIPNDVSTVFVAGPFFDPALAFVRLVQRDVRPRRMVIGIDPQSVEIDPAAAADLLDVEWLNVANLLDLPQQRRGASRYLHAKVLWFAGQEGELLVTGSANPGVAAFLATPATRNAEAVVADSSVGAAERLGIQLLVHAPAVSATDWDVVRERRRQTMCSNSVVSRRIVMATPAPIGFLAQEPLDGGLVFSAVDPLDLPLGEAVSLGNGFVEAGEAVRNRAAYLEAQDEKQYTVVVVHRTETVAQNFGSDTTKALRLALGLLDDDPMQVEVLLKLAEKVIFESEDVARTPLIRAGVDADTLREGTVAPTVLALGVDEKNKQSRHRSTLASGDMAMLLDALIRRLGEGVPADHGSHSRNEEEAIGADEENGGDIVEEALDFEGAAKSCRAKLRRLVSRMLERLEHTDAPENSRKSIVQLAAVLSVIRALRLIEQRPEWELNRCELVDRSDERNFFQTAVLAFAWGEKGLASRAMAETDGHVDSEVSMTVGLLAWLAWDLGIDISANARRVGIPLIGNSDWTAIQLFATLGPWLVDDVTAQELLRDSVSRTPRHGVQSPQWLQAQISALETYAIVCASPDEYGIAERDPKPGDLMVLHAKVEPRVRVVLDVGRRDSSDTVCMFEPATDKRTRVVRRANVRTLKWH